MSRQASRFGAKAPKAQSLFFAQNQGNKPCTFATLMNQGHQIYPAILPILFSQAFPYQSGTWRDADRDISAVMSRYNLANSELHTAWLMRKYLEQSRIPGFDQLNYSDRKSAVVRYRNTYLLDLQRNQSHKTYKQSRKNYDHTADYVHLTLPERQKLIFEIAQKVSHWGFARLFAECIDKTHFDPLRTNASVDEQAFEQVVSRFERYLQSTDTTQGQRNYGLIVHDNNKTIARKHTNLMREFHKKGTLWTSIERIIETPLFVDSELTRLVQIADLCCYAIRRYLENGEVDLFAHVFERADRRNQTVVGVRHFSTPTCDCLICQERKTNSI